VKRVAISIGDLNGIGIQLALENHETIRQIVDPVYCIDDTMLGQAAELLGIEMPEGFTTVEPFAEAFTIRPGEVDAASGAYSYASFVHAVGLARAGLADAVTTLPIHKKAWEMAGIGYKGHTDALRDFFDAEAIMMLGCPRMYVALYTEHIPLREVADSIEEASLTRFLVDFYRTAGPRTPVAVLGLNPHAGDNGVLGNEERIIEAAIRNANQTIHHPPSTIHHQPSTIHHRPSTINHPPSTINHPPSTIDHRPSTIHHQPSTINHQPSTIDHRPSTIDHEPFTGPLVPDVAFTPNVRKHYTHYVAMYHDQGLAPLKALHFDEGINVSLNLPILRTSVDHGTAFDIAYKGETLNSLSYINAVKYVVDTQ